MLSLKVIDLSSEVDRWERRYHEEIKLRLPLEREILMCVPSSASGAGCSARIIWLTSR